MAAVMPPPVVSAVPPAHAHVRAAVVHGARRPVDGRRRRGDDVEAGQAERHHDVRVGAGCPDEERRERAQGEEEFLHRPRTSFGARRNTGVRTVVTRRASDARDGAAAAAAEGERPRPSCADTSHGYYTSGAREAVAPGVATTGLTVFAPRFHHPATQASCAHISAAPRPFARSPSAPSSWLRVPRTRSRRRR